jgi:hypothetical protein
VCWDVIEEFNDADDDVLSLINQHGDDASGFDDDGMQQVEASRVDAGGDVRLEAALEEQAEKLEEEFRARLAQEFRARDAHLSALVAARVQSLSLSMNEKVDAAKVEARSQVARKDREMLEERQQVNEGHTSCLEIFIIVYFT